MTTSIFIANKGPKTLYVLAWGPDPSVQPALIATLEPGQTTNPDHCHVHERRMIVVSESKPEVTEAVATLSEAVDDDDETEPHTNTSEPVAAVKAGDKI